MKNEFTKMSIEDLRKTVVDMSEKLRTIRHATAGSRSRNVNESRDIRREIARAHTEIRARELAHKPENA